jgi:hypothetical protein
MRHHVIRAVAAAMALAIATAGGAEGQATMQRAPGGVKITVRQTTETTLISGLVFNQCRRNADCASGVNALLLALVSAFGSPVAKAFDDLDQDGRRSVQNATLYFTDLRMRMDAGDSTMIIRLAADGSGLDMVFLERGKLLMVVPLDQIRRGGPGLDPGLLGGGASELNLHTSCPPGTTCPQAGISVRRLGGTRELLGHSTQHYLLQVYASTPERAAGATLPVLNMSRNLHAWVATDGLAAGVIQAFYRNQAAAFGRVEGNPRLVTALTAISAVVADLGFPLLSSQADTILVTSSTDIGLVPIILQASTDSILSFSTEPLDPGLFEVAGVPPPGGAATCDCSCAGYAEFQALTKRKQDELRRDPEAMRKVMCGRECLTKWIRCAQ